MNYFQKLARASAYCPVTGVRNPAEIMQTNLCRWIFYFSGTKEPWKAWNWKSEALKNSRGFDNYDSLVHELHEKQWLVLLCSPLDQTRLHINSHGSGPKKPWQPQTWQDLTRISPLDFLLLSPGFRGLVLLNCTGKYWRKSKKSSGEPPVETAPRNCRFLSLVVVERALNGDFKL